MYPFHKFRRPLRIISNFVSMIIIQKKSLEDPFLSLLISKNTFGTELVVDMLSVLRSTGVNDGTKCDYNPCNKCVDD